MIDFIGIEQAQEWDDIVKSFANYDVYYLSGYVKAFMLHGDGDPYLMHYKGDRLRAIYVFMMRRTDVSGTFDSITPYGYGGVLFEGKVTLDNCAIFWDAYKDAMLEMNIIDNFVRYHPVLANAIPMKSLTNVVDLGKTIAMDLSSPGIIWDNIHSKNRNMIRKAEKNGVEIHHGKEKELFKDFRRIYDETMRRDEADDYYYFGDTFYESIHRDLFDNYEMFWATYNHEIVAMSIMIFANRRLSYHLSGSEIEYRHLAPSNLLLYEAALWGCEQGMKTFHLGGGIGSREDSLYKFKKGFNKNSDYQFSIGKDIFDQVKYDELVKQRMDTDLNFDPKSMFFPLYRMKI